MIFKNKHDVRGAPTPCTAFVMLTMLLLKLVAESVAVVVNDEWRVHSSVNNFDSSRSSWQDMSLPPTTVHRCVPVPSNMRICHGIGYDFMRLPNMLNHETVGEAITQITHWDMLKRTNCHSELPIFLCSMYAPVCVREFPDKEIRPCRSLCEAVKQECFPVMRRYGYEWPEMANCTKFPGSEDPMCIRNQENANANCKACKSSEDVTVEFLVSRFCINNVVFKARIKKVYQLKAADGSIERAVQFRKLRHKAFLRSDGVGRLGRIALRKGKLRQDSNAKCKCQWLDGLINRKDKFLIMGEFNHTTNEVDIKFIHKWVRKRGGAFRKGIRQIRKSLRGRIPNICSNRIIPRKIAENRRARQKKARSRARDRTRKQRKRNRRRKQRTKGGRANQSDARRRSKTRSWPGNKNMTKNNNNNDRNHNPAVGGDNRGSKRRANRRGGGRRGSRRGARRGARHGTRRADGRETRTRGNKRRSKKKQRKSTSSRDRLTRSSQPMGV